MKITTIDILKLICGDLKERQEVISKIEKINDYLRDVLDIFDTYFQTYDLNIIDESLSLSNIAFPDVDEED